MAALVAALLTQASDRTPWLTAVLSTRFAKPGAIILGAAIALTAGNGIAAALGAYLAPRIPLAGRDLMLALTLVSAGGSALFPIKLKDRLGGWKIGAFLTSLLGVATMAAGDRAQFITFALGARSPDAAILAAIGATIGALAVNIPAILLGEAWYKALPMTPIRVTIGILFLSVGSIVGLGAIGLI